MKECREIQLDPSYFLCQIDRLPFQLVIILSVFSYFSFFLLLRSFFGEQKVLSLYFFFMNQLFILWFVFFVSLTRNCFTPPSHQCKRLCSKTLQTRVQTRKVVAHVDVEPRLFMCPLRCYVCHKASTSTRQTARGLFTPAICNCFRDRMVSLRLCETHFELIVQFRFSYFIA